MTRSPIAAAPASEGKHTPGPWRIAPASDYSGTDLNIDAGDRGQRAYICKVGFRGDPQVQADALLIAAAPDFDAAAREIDRQAGQMDGHLKAPVVISYDAIIALRAAIAKAEGRS